MLMIRRFEVEDGPAVRDMIYTIMSDEFREDQEAYPTQDIESLPDSYGGLGEAFFVAVNDASIVGTVAIKKEDDRIALMRRLFVAPKHRKRKIGLKLIERALQFCDEMGYDEVIFRTTSRMQGAAKACQKQGFSPRAKLQMGSMELLKFSRSLRSKKKS